jgi:hypothetical protein
MMRDIFSFILKIHLRKKPLESQGFLCCTLTMSRFRHYLKRVLGAFSFIQQVRAKVQRLYLHQHGLQELS